MADRTTSVAALYDIHGNLPALEAALAEIDAIGVDAVVVGGDIVTGPLPAETLEALRRRHETLFVRGNADREVALNSPAPDNEAARLAWGWTTAHLHDGQRTWLAELPLSLAVHMDSLGTALFCHGSPRSDDEIITALSPDERVAPMLADVAEALIVCGHTHVQFNRTVEGHRVVNSGSVGLPYQDEPGAYWTLFTDDVEFRRTTYDLDRAADRIAATGFPEADDFIEILRRPPASHDASAHFEKMARQKG